MRVFIIALLASMLLLAGCIGGGERDVNYVLKDSVDEGEVNAAQGSPVQGEESGNIAGIDPKIFSDEEANKMMNENNPVVVFETSKGKVRAEIFVEEAPITGENFISLVESGFYNNLTFHRVESGFVVQGGDPKGDGTGGSNKTIKLEIKPELRHNIGSLGMARSQDPDSASSQFYFVTGEASFLDGQYAVFGQVLDDGMEVVNKLKIGDRMQKVYVEKE